MLFNVLFLQEHGTHDVSEIDNKIAILYDEEEGKFFYYSLRNKNELKYNCSYHYTRLNNLADFIRYICNDFSSVITHEFHSIDIYSYEYDSLNYETLYKKLSKSNEIVAYDWDTISHEEVKTILNIMITHEV